MEDSKTKNILKHCLGIYDFNQTDGRNAEDKENVELLNKSAVGSLTLAVSAFFLIALLFYEIAVVNFVFLKKTHALKKGLDKLNENDMKEYVIIEGGATEVIWRT